ncbi:hypothetical protein ACWD4F_07470 [Streptomyces aureus]|uniref:Uncharacterized protein n=1 Tax=Streptomyces triticiradicis TaxID=2651189 RepID=A0A7J5DM61_9ACTN|nr:hypothetical protein [Streptomyces triticiradicis]KAB1989830.1 hypothetical protein F8144_05650 [Streptomyces triticiradicis]
MTKANPKWWVVCEEPNPAQQDVVSVEPEPTGADAVAKRTAELAAAGQYAYAITAPDADTASDIAFRAWAERLASTPARLAAANAYIARNNRTS